jgi:hypothetical protein
MRLTKQYKGKEEKHILIEGKKEDIEKGIKNIVGECPDYRWHTSQSIHKTFYEEGKPDYMPKWFSVKGIYNSLNKRIWPSNDSPMLGVIDLGGYTLTVECDHNFFSLDEWGTISECKHCEEIQYADEEEDLECKNGEEHNWSHEYQIHGENVKLCMTCGAFG